MKDIKTAEQVLKALANRRRLAIVKYLQRKRQAAVGDIAEEIKLSFKSTSRHLAILFASNILERQQTSTNVLYSLNSHLARSYAAVLKKVLAIL